MQNAHQVVDVDKGRLGKAEDNNQPRQQNENSTAPDCFPHKACHALAVMRR
ncbi:hypothetical protein GOZ86_02955 [Agrobacterium vitis]|nr:hypothetical protein [Agrobacterium vitis]